VPGVGRLDSPRGSRCQIVCPAPFSALPNQILARAHRKLVQIDEAQELSQLRIPPSNRLEALRGDLKGFYSIRINQQWRIIFKWSEGDAFEAEIVDYH
jgi:proteic killer suppression protein